MDDESANKGGAPVGNTNALKNGSRSKQVSRGGELRKDEKNIQAARVKWIKRLEAVIVERFGHVSISRQLMIESTCDLIAKKQILQRLYRIEKEIDLKDRVLLLESIQKTNDEILKQIPKLGIEVSPDEPDDGDDDWPT